MATDRVMDFVPMTDLRCACRPSATGIAPCPTHYYAPNLLKAVVGLLDHPFDNHARVAAEKLVELIDG